MRHLELPVKRMTIDWLMDSDPAIRWQVMRDVLHSSEPHYEKERARLLNSGWAARLLSLQNDEGLWNRSLYNGKWISTTYTLYLLKLLGLPPLTPQALKGCDQLLRQGLYKKKELRFSRNQDVRDLGVSALVLSSCAYFKHADDSLSNIARFLKRQQRDDGSWLPNASPAAASYAFDTTLLALEALLQFRQLSPGDDPTGFAKAESRGKSFLLRHHLYLDKGKPIKAKWTSFAFPPYWFYDVLAALEYFQRSGTDPDVQLQPAIQLLLRRRSQDGTWPLGPRHPGKTHFEMEERGKPSRWNTLRALRVLEWWDSGG